MFRTSDFAFRSLVDGNRSLEANGARAVVVLLNRGDEKPLAVKGIVVEEVPDQRIVGVRVARVEPACARDSVLALDERILARGNRLRFVARCVVHALATSAFVDGNRPSPRFRFDPCCTFGSEALVDGNGAPLSCARCAWRGDCYLQAPCRPEKEKEKGRIPFRAPDLSFALRRTA